MLRSVKQLFVHMCSGEQIYTYFAEEKIYISFPHCPTQSFTESEYNAKKLTTMFFSYHCQHIHFDVDDNVDNQIGCFSLNRAYAQVYWVV